jgi:pimeloyl-ACP methyl ester carboxylesterase
VHGAWHGAWCWDLLRAELHALGHESVAMDLPAGDGDAGLDRYADVVVEAVTSGGGTSGPVVVVGHSLGGLTATVAAARLEASGLVFLDSFIPSPGRSFDEQAREDGRERFSPGWPALAGRQQQQPDGSSCWAPDDAVEAFFHDCPPDQANAAAAKLRPQHWRPSSDPCPLDALPDIRMAVIVNRDDRCVSPSFAEGDALDRLGVEALELPGGHSPMLARPAVLAIGLGAFADGPVADSRG